MKIELIRHGETALNAAGRYQGAWDLPLSQRGRSLLVPAKDCPRRVYVSPLLRAVETAELLFPLAERIPVPGLQEMHFGAFEGRSAEEMVNDADYRRWVDGNCEGLCPGGESRSGFCQRVCAAFVPLLEECRSRGEERLVIVAHGGTQMAILEAFGAPPRPFYCWRTGNGRGFVLEDRLWTARRVLTLLGEVDYTGGSLC